MGKYLFWCLWLLLPQLGVAQLKHDVNWVFGENIGIDFTSHPSPLFFNSFANYNLEANASISDTSGQLQLYLSIDNSGLGNVKDASNNLILNGDSINIEMSTTNGALFLPASRNDLDSIHMFHIGVDDGKLAIGYCVINCIILL